LFSNFSITCFSTVSGSAQGYIIEMVKNGTLIAGLASFGKVLNEKNHNKTDNIISIIIKALKCFNSFTNIFLNYYLQISITPSNQSNTSTEFQLISHKSTFLTNTHVQVLTFKKFQLILFITYLTGICTILIILDLSLLSSIILSIFSSFSIFSKLKFNISPSLNNSLLFK
jgi:hypothetical protein